MAECDLSDLYAVLCSIDEKLAWQNLALKKIVDAAVDITARYDAPKPLPDTIQEGSLMKMKDPTVDPTFPTAGRECARRGHIWSGPEEVDNRWCIRCGVKVNV